MCSQSNKCYWDLSMQETASVQLSKMNKAWPSPIGNSHNLTEKILKRKFSPSANTLSHSMLCVLWEEWMESVMERPLLIWGMGENFFRGIATTDSAFIPPPQFLADFVHVSIIREGCNRSKFWLAKPVMVIPSLLPGLVYAWKRAEILAKEIWDEVSWGEI